MEVVVEKNTLINYLALGDSYTIGECVSESERWPSQLARTFIEKGKAVQQPVIIAATGWRTDNLANAVNIAQLKEEYDLVSLLIGVNNQYQGKPIGQYQIDFEELLNTSVRLAKGKTKNVFVVSIPDYGFTPFALNPDNHWDKEKISAEIDAFNAVAKSICNQHHIKFVDITSISREGLNDASLIASDGLHPSRKMYSLWAEKIANSI